MNQCTTQNSLRAAGIGDHFTLLDSSGNSNPGTQPLSNPPTPTNKSSAQPKSAHIKPVDDETPDENPGTTGPNAEANTFAKAIYKFVKANYSSSKPKLWEPDPFDGSDSQKLRTFIL